MCALDLQRFLPIKLRIISRLIGLEETLKLVEHYANSRLYIPFKSTPKIDFLSVEAQHLLCRDYGGTTLVIPKCQTLKNFIRDKEITEKISNGAKVTHLAHEYGLTSRWVHRIINDIRQ